MAGTTFEDVIHAVTLRLREAFPDYSIFVEDVPQNLDPPAFFVRLLTVGHVHEGGLWYPDNGRIPQGSRYKRNPIVEVVYFPQSNPGRMECEQMREQLMWALEFVQSSTGATLGARNMDTNISNDVLVMTMRYPHFLKTDQPQQVMEHFNLNLGGNSDG